MSAKSEDELACEAMLREFWREGVAVGVPAETLFIAFGMRSTKSMSALIDARALYGDDLAFNAEGIRRYGDRWHALIAGASRVDGPPAEVLGDALARMAGVIPAQERGK